MFISPQAVTGDFNLLETELFKDFMSDVVKPVGYLSGFNIFDYPTSHCDTNGNTGMLLQNGGLFPRIYTCVGESESGKTMMMIQLAGSIVDNYGGTLVYIDAEGNCTPERIMSLNNWDPMEFKKKCLYRPSSPPITINGVYDMIRKVAHAKSVNKKQLTMKTPFINPYDGKFIEVMVPTVVLLDSLPYLVISQSLDEMIDEDGKGDFKEVEKISENIDAMREAKDNTNFLKKVKSLLDEWNIVLIMNNHIVKEQAMSMFDKPKKYLPGLKPGEKLKGGSQQIYSAFGIFRISQSEQLNDKNPIYGDHIRGSINYLDMVKNKSNISAAGYPYVVDKRKGFCPELSDFEYLFSKKKHIQGSPMAMYLTILPEVKFTRKTLFEKCHENPILRRALNFTVQYEMGNEYVLQYRFGHVDLEKLAQLPLEWRVSIFTCMTFEYPQYRKEMYTQAYQEMIRMAVLGNFYTRLGFEYISPLNVPLLNQLAELADTDYCRCQLVDNVPSAFTGLTQI